MFQSNKKLTAKELKGLYPGISLIEGYDEALVGVVTAPSDEFIPVYDTFTLIDVISRLGFTSKKDLNDYFVKLVQATKGDGLGPMFMQSAKIKKVNNVEHDDEVDDVFNSDDEAWSEDSSSDSDSYEEEELPFGYKYADSDSDSDSGIESSIEEDNSDEYETKYDKEGGPFLQLSVHIGNNDPDECQITSNTKDVKDAIRLLFPHLTRLEVVKEIKFLFANIEDVEDMEDDDSDDMD
jgi:hypothetical protein